MDVVNLRPSTRACLFPHSSNRQFGITTHHDTPIGTPNPPTMAAFTRLIRSTTSSANFTSHLRRGFATTAVSDSIESSAFNPSLTFKKDPKNRNVQWIFLGCPGVGKGTYASRLSKLLGVPHIATGDLVREELSSTGPLASTVCI